MVVRDALGALALAGVLATGSCVANRERIVIEPGVQIAEASVDVESGAVTVEREGVIVEAQGAMLPSPRRETLHPTFWVTVENTRDDRISVKPADARLVDTFGNRLQPLPPALQPTPLLALRSLLDTGCGPGLDHGDPTSATPEAGP